MILKRIKKKKCAAWIKLAQGRIGSMGVVLRILNLKNPFHEFLDQVSSKLFLIKGTAMLAINLESNYMSLYLATASSKEKRHVVTKVPDPVCKCGGNSKRTQRFTIKLHEK
jgi:hypothetical protein